MTKFSIGSKVVSKEGHKGVVKEITIHTTDMGTTNWYTIRINDFLTIVEREEDLQMPAPEVTITWSIPKYLCDLLIGFPVKLTKYDKNYHDAAIIAGLMYKSDGYVSLTTLGHIIQDELKKETVSNAVP